MSALKLVIEREYTSRARKKSFIIMTFLTPFLIVGFMIGVFWLATIRDGNVRSIAIVDQTGIYAPLFESTDSYIFQIKSERVDICGEFFAVLTIMDNLKDNPQAVSLISGRQVPQELLSMIRHTLNEKVMQQRLDAIVYAEEVSAEAVAQVRSVFDDRSGISLRTLRWDNDGDVRETSTKVATAIGFLFTFLIYMFVLTYGMMVMQAVMEEKKTRIVEVMVSSIKPIKLLIGKIIGIGLVGITQLLMWGVLVSVLMLGASFFISMPTPEMPMTPIEISGFDIEGVLGTVLAFNWLQIIVFFGLFFVGGYILYASLLAMLAASVDSDEDLAQFMMPIMIILTFGFYAGIYSVQNPDGPLAFWASLIPFTSPIVMMIRIPFDIPMWEKLVSLALLYGTFILIAFIAAKIYRVGILMYGKKPTIKEMVKWLRYK